MSVWLVLPLTSISLGSSMDSIVTIFLVLSPSLSLQFHSLSSTNSRVPSDLFNHVSLPLIHPILFYHSFPPVFPYHLSLLMLLPLAILWQQRVKRYNGAVLSWFPLVFRQRRWSCSCYSKLRGTRRFECFLSSLFHLQGEFHEPAHWSLLTFPLVLYLDQLSHSMRLVSVLIVTRVLGLFFKKKFLIISDLPFCRPLVVALSSLISLKSCLGGCLEQSATNFPWLGKTPFITFNMLQW